LGTLAGGWLGDKMDRRREGGGLRMSGVGLLLAAPLMYLAVQVHALVPMLAVIFLAQFLIFLNSGPINAALVNGVPPAFRAFAMGLNVLFIHMLGDAISPTAIGKLADVASLGFAIELNAIPVLLGGVALLMAGRLFKHVTS
jgi:MFS transporter, Spinster family, sphingosine-1-phosphate transporter